MSSNNPSFSSPVTAIIPSVDQRYRLAINHEILTIKSMAKVNANIKKNFFI
jgi:hypothetical protein